MDLENCKHAAQFRFAQPQNASVPPTPIPNATPFIDFGLKCACYRSHRVDNQDFVVMQMLNFSFLMRCEVQISRVA